MKDYKKFEIFSEIYLHIHFSGHTSGTDWWMDEQNKDWWSGSHIFDCDALYYVEDGNFELRVGKKQYEVGPGQMCYIPAGTEHERRICSDQPLRKYYCHFDLMLGTEPLNHFFKIPYIFAADNTEKVSELFQSLLQYSKMKDVPFASIGGKGLLLQLIALSLEKNNAEFSYIQASGEYSMQAVSRYIHRNLHRAISIEDLARLSGYSPTHFSKVFKKMFGRPPLAYITDLKLSRAKKLLRETRFSISDIAEELGFCDASYFNKFFKNKTGLSPTEYRFTYRHRV